MIKKFIVLSAMLGLIITTGCTSQNAKDESGDQVVTEGGELENVGGDATASADGLDASAGTTEGGELATDPALDAGAQANTSDQLSEDSLGDVPAAPNEVVSEAPAQDPAAAPTDTAAAPPADNLSPTDTLSSTPPPALDTPPPLETSSGLTESVPPVSSEDKPKASLKKIAPEPWKVGKVWFNTVYFARPGDSLSKISQKIYGDESRVKEIKKGNPTLSNNVKPGTKVYYNSPNRPDDSTKVITYFEDNGIPPKTYIAKKGDNIRTVSKDLLGYKNAWQEVWASNPVESKAELDEGTELKYWSEEPGATAVAKTEPTTEVPPAPPSDVGMNNPAGDPNMVPPAPPIEPPPPPPDMAAQQPPPPPDMAMQQPPPPPPDAVAPPPPPPPDVAMAPPPPPPVAPPPKPADDALAGSPLEGMDQDTMMIVGLVGVGLILMVSMFIRNKKRRQREFEQAMNETQVGT